MTTLHNEITIKAPMAKIWEALTDIECLDQYDPTVKKSTAVTNEKMGIGAKRKVDMLDGKNWFEEKVTVYKPNESLEYELTACSFPIHHLKHTYSFEKIGDQVKVKQTMQYQMKYGFLGKIMDALLVRKKSDKGIKLFFSGLKNYTENN